MYCCYICSLCFSTVGEETPDSVSEIQQSGIARLSFDDQEYQKVEQLCYIQYIRHTHVYTKNVVFFISSPFHLKCPTTQQANSNNNSCVGN